MRTREAGFALTEVLVALVLVGVVLWAGLRFFYIGSAEVRGARVRTIASNLASEGVELIRALPYDQVGLSTAVVNPWYGAEPVVTAAPGIASSQTITRYQTAFQMRTYITYVDAPNDGLGGADADGPSDYKRIFVTVDWPGGTQIRMTTFLAQD